MDELLILVLGLACTLSVVALVGHGLWIASAAILRLAFRSERASYVSAGSVFETREELDATCRQLERMFRKRELSAEEYARMRDLLDASYARYRAAPPPRIPLAAVETAVEIAHRSVREVREQSAPRSAAQAAITPAMGAAALSGETAPPPTTIPDGVFEIASAVPVSAAEDIVFAEVVTLPPVDATMLASVASRSAQATSPVPVPKSPFDFEDTAPVHPARPLAEILTSFMLEKNIRWGELISGMLIVGSAVGLVISLRQELQRAIPYFPALLFMLVTAAIHGAGVYTLRQWNLKATSRGVLTIGLLLVPLNFLAACLLGGQRAATDPWFLIALGVGITSFAAMTYFSCRHLLDRDWWACFVPIMAASAWQVVIHRVAGDASPGLLQALAAVPLAGFLVGNLGLHAWLQKKVEPTEQDMERALLTLGISSFGLATALGLLLISAPALRPALGQLSIAVAATTGAWLSAGFALYRWCDSADKENTKTLRIVGTSLVLMGGFVSIVALVLAWPQPALLVGAAVLGFGVLAFAADRGSMPALHAGALLHLAVAAVVGSHWLLGHYSGASLVRAHLDTALSATTSFALTAVVLLAAVLAWMRGSENSPESAARRRYFVGTAAFLALLSVGVAGLTGFLKGGVTDLHIATGILFFYAIAAMLAGAWTRGRYLLRTGEGLLLLAFLHGLVANVTLREQLPWPQLNELTAWLGAFLAHGVVCALASLVALRVGRREPAPEADGSSLRSLAIELATGGMLTSFLAVPVACYCYSYASPWLAINLATICVIWLFGASLRRSRSEFAMAQALSFAALATAASATSLRWGWHAIASDPQHLRLLLSVGAGGCAGWGLLRLWIPVETKVERLLRPVGVTVDRCVLGAVTLLAVLAATWACVPGVRAELGYRTSAPEYTAAAEWARSLGHFLWIPLGCIAIAYVVTLLQRLARPALDGLLITGAAAMMLAAQPMDANGGTASALRWTLSAYGLFVALVLWQRQRVGRVWDSIRASLRPATADASTSRLSSSFTWLSLAVTILPLLLLVTLAASQGIQRVPFGGPAKDSWLGWIPVEVNYGMPLVFVVAALLSHAVQRRQSNYALCGSMILMYLLGVGFYLLLTSGENLARAKWLVQIMQWGTIGTSAYGLLWLWLHPRIRKDRQMLPIEDRHLASHVAIPGLMTVLLGGTALASVALRPLAGSPVNAAIGMPLGYCSLAATLVLYGWYLRQRCVDYLPTLLAGFSVAGLGVAVGSTCGGPTGVTWLPNRVLMLGCVGVAAVTCLVPWVVSRWRRSEQATSASIRSQSGLWGSLAGLAAFAVSWRTAFDDPQGAGWALGAIAALLALVTVLGFRFTPALGYVGAALIVTAGIYVTQLPQWTGRPVWLFHGILVAIALYAIGWLPTSRNRPWSMLPAFPHAAKIVLLVLLCGMVTLEFLIQCFERVYLPLRGDVIETPTGWAVIVSVGCLLVCSLWDVTSRRRLLQPHIWGLAFVLLASAFGLDGHALFAWGGLAAAAYFCLWGWLWRNQDRVVRAALTLRISDAAELVNWTAVRFVIRQVVFVIGLSAIQLIPLVGFTERPLRFAAALVPLLGALAVAAMSTAARYRWLPTISLLLFTLFGIYAGWADLEAGDTAALWLLRTIRLLIVLAFMTFFYGGVVPRYLAVSGDWIHAFKRTTTLLAGATVVSLITVLAFEWATYQPDLGVPLVTTPLALAVTAVLVAMIIGLLAVAVLPQRDPLALSLSGRMMYVYVAQAVGALIFLHIWMTMPWLFHHRLRPFWPYIVMVIAFAGVGLAELFQRRNLTVLSEPFARTGMLLPLIPAGLMWFIGHNSEPSAVLLAVGMLYLVVGVLRGSLVLGATAILFGNLALWAFYGKFDEWSFVDRPQFWLIPPALCVLVAGQVNRSRLSDGQLAALRYLCVAVIYVSSTSEIFITGIGENLWPPIILAVLAVLGVLAGMMLQIRAFLFLGSSFLFVSLLSMVMHAHQTLNHVWPWWAFGVGMGVAILVMFGLFEKKRPELTAWVERIRRWET